MAETNFEQLKIEVSASASDAAKEVKNLADQLESLRTISNKGIKNPIQSSVDSSNSKAEKTAKETQKLLGKIKERVRLRIDSGDADKAKKKIGMLSKTLNSLSRIAFYRAIRTAIKAITDAFQSGAENAYWYSRTMGGQIGYVADAFDSLSSTSFKMSNQLGAAWATLKAAITPILIQIINLVTQAANALTQFFAALGGKSVYMKAADYTKKWADATASGAKAAKEWKNQLMGFDEINRLEEPSSGGSGGSGAATPDYSQMFETEEVSEKFKKVADFILDHLEQIKDLAIATGIAIAAWKVGRLFTSNIKKLLGIAIAVAGAFVLGKNALDAWNNGVTFDNLFGMLEGAAALVIGLGIAFGSVGAAIGFLISGVTLLAVGIKDIVEKGELTTESFYAIEAGIFAVGGAFALFTGSWIPLAIAAVVGLVVAVIKNWGEITQFFKETWGKITGFFVENFTLFKTQMSEFGAKASETWAQFKSDVVGAWEAIKQTASTVWSFVVSIVKWAVNSMISGIEGWINGAIAGINWLLGGVSKVVSFLGGTNVSLAINPISLPRFASGGFPEDGLFLANHNELVGTFGNGRTAVANNEQIEAGIAAAVQDGNEGVIAVLYQLLAVANDIAKNGSGGDGFNMTALSREVSRYQARAARANGT